MAATTIASLVARHDALVAELAEVRAEIAARAGQVDPPPKPKRSRRAVGT